MSSNSTPNQAAPVYNFSTTNDPASHQPILVRLMPSDSGTSPLPFHPLTITHNFLLIVGIIHISRNETLTLHAIRNKIEILAYNESYGLSKLQDIGDLLYMLPLKIKAHWEISNRTYNSLLKKDAELQGAIELMERRGWKDWLSAELVPIQ